MRQPVLSRHRLPHPYRQWLTFLWVLPAALLLAAAMCASKFSLAVLDPRLLLPLAVMILPAWYCWQEGLDVMPSGILRRTQIPRFFRYDELGTWYFDARQNKRLLIIRDEHNRIVIQCRASHLTDLQLLLRTLKDHVRPRNWPN